MRAQLAATLRFREDSIHQWARIRSNQWNRHMYQCVRYGRDDAREETREVSREDDPKEQG